MVAVVTGNGLGLQRTSGFVLGSGGTLGDAATGRLGSNVTVNAPSSSDTPIRSPNAASKRQP